MAAADVRWTVLRAHFTAGDRVISMRERSHIEYAAVAILRSQQAAFPPCRLLASAVSERIRPSRVADDPYTEREIVRACAAAKDEDRAYRFQLSRDILGRIEISLEGSSQASEPSAEILQGRGGSAQTEGERGGESQQQAQRGRSRNRRRRGDARRARHRDRRRKPPRRRLPSPPPSDWVADRYRLGTGANMLSLRPRKRKSESEGSRGSDGSRSITLAQREDESRNPNREQKCSPSDLAGRRANQKRAGAATAARPLPAPRGRTTPQDASKEELALSMSGSQTKPRQRQQNRRTV